MNLPPGLERLLSELQRRHTFRAAAVYLAAAFVVLQVADILVEPLSLPSWTMPLLVVVVAVGFVLTLVLAWAFELTPDGVQRTQALPGDDTAISRPVWRRPRRSTVLAVMIAALLGGSWFARDAWTGPAEASGEGAIAVLPFRVSSGGDLDYLREGLVDLLSGVLEEKAGLPVVSPRLLLRELGDDGDDDAGRAAGIVTRLGGERVITGEVVGRASHLTITATLQSLDGSDPIRVSVSGGEHELEQLVNRVAAELLAREYAELTTGGGMQDVPVDALREYLEGMALQRQSRFSESLQRFRRALEIDSTFAAAALGFEVSASWVIGVRTDEWQRVRSLMWRHRDRLGQLDRLQVEGILGPDYPDISAPSVRLRIVERGLEAMPDRPELWYLYGDILFHEGQAIGVADWRRLAVSAFERARAIAPDHPEAEYHLLELALASGDTVLLTQVANGLLASDSTEDLRPFVHGMLALHHNTDAAWAQYRSDARNQANSSLFDIALASLTTGSGTQAVLEVAREEESRAVTSSQAATPLEVQIQLLGNGGRPGDLLRASERRLKRQGASGRAEHLQLAAWVGYAWDGDTVVARESLEELRSMLDEQAQTAGAEPPLPYLVCTVATIDVLNGRADWASAARPWLERATAELENPLEQMQGRGCRFIIDAGVAHVRGPRDEAQRQLRALESYLTGRPFGSKRLRTIANLLATVLHQENDDPASALNAARRMQDTAMPNLLSTALREEGRLLEQLGRPDEAAAVYRHYLAIRPDPEPSVRAIDDGIRARLTALQRQ